MKRAFSLHVAVAAFLLCMHAACSTVPSVGDAIIEPADRRILIENRISESIVSDPLFAAQLIAYHQQQGELFLDHELDLFYPALEKALSDELQERLREGRFREAVAWLDSAKIAGVGAPPALAAEEILRMEALRHLERDNYLPLLFTMYQLVSYSQFALDELTAILSIAERHNHTQLIQLILRDVGERHPDLLEAYRAAADSRAELADMLNGTVTVWVDKGFAITDGVGHPDRVFGSAFFVDARGYLITNYHVIASEVDPEYEGFSRLYVRLSDDNLRVPAKVIGYDRLLDIALLKTEIEPDYIFALEPRRGRYVSGTRIYALGSPVGLEQSIASGIISSSSRQFLPIGETLQIDTPVNPGNSGGPLVNDEGALIGVVYAGVPQFQGINFAIPISWVWQSIPNLFSAMNDNHLWLGVAVRRTNERLEVIYVMPGSPADEIGIKVGDALVSINGRAVRDIGDAQTRLAEFYTSRLARVGWQIDEVARSYPMRIVKRPYSPVEEALRIQRRETLFAPLFGMNADRVGTNPNTNRYVITKVYSATIADELGFAASDPFTVLRWHIDDEQRAALMHINIQKTKSGFTASGLQIGNTLDLPNFI